MPEMLLPFLLSNSLHNLLAPGYTASLSAKRAHFAFSPSIPLGCARSGGPAGSGMRRGGEKCAHFSPPLLIPDPGNVIVQAVWERLQTSWVSVAVDGVEVYSCKWAAGRPGRCEAGPAEELLPGAHQRLIALS